MKDFSIYKNENNIFCRINNATVRKYNYNFLYSKYLEMVVKKQMT